MILRDLLTLFSSWTFCLMQQDGMGLSVNVYPIMMTLAAEGALPNEICNLFVFATNDMYSRAAMNWVHVCTYGLRSAQCSKPTFAGSAWRRRRLLCHVDGAEEQCGRGISLNVHSAAESCRLVKSCTIRKGTCTSDQRFLTHSNCVYVFIGAKRPEKVSTFLD